MTRTVRRHEPRQAPRSQPSEITSPGMAAVLLTKERMMMPMRWGWTLVALALTLVGPARQARACSPGQAPAATAIPRAGATAVSTATSIVIVSQREPFGVNVLANGQVATVSGWWAIGSGIDGSGGPTNFWQLFLGSPDGLLAPSTDYVVTWPAGTADGGDATLTTFSTAAGYDKTAGTAANLRSFHLWRVRYPVADIASGNCVFAEYASFVTVDYDPATLPNTPPGSRHPDLPAGTRHRRDPPDLRLHGRHAFHRSRPVGRVSAAARAVAAGPRSDAALLSRGERDWRRQSGQSRGRQQPALRRCRPALRHRRAAAAGHRRRHRWRSRPAPPAAEAGRPAAARRPARPQAGWASPPLRPDCASACGRGADGARGRATSVRRRRELATRFSSDRLPAAAFRGSHLHATSGPDRGCR